MKNLKITKNIFIFGIVLGSAFVSSCGTKELNLDVFYKAPQHSQLIYTINESSMNEMETEMIVSLQGIVAKVSPSIYIINSKEEFNWLDEIQKEDPFVIKSVNSAWTLVDAFKSYIKDSKYVKYISSYEKEASFRDQSINYATTVASVESYLMVSSSLEDTAKEHGLVFGLDVTNENNKSMFEKYQSKLNKTMLVHQSPEKWQLRDYAIAGGFFCFYSDYDDGSGSDAYKAIFEWSNKNAPILGWTENEVDFVEYCSALNKFVVASDWSSNLSMYSSLSLKDKYVQSKRTIRDIKPDANKHYVSIVMSDGDNLQWMQNGFATNEKYYGSEYRGSFPMTWAIAPSTSELAPQVLNYLYENQTEMDDIICGPSGVGYINPSNYNNNEEFAKITNNYMGKADLQSVNFLDVFLDTAKYDAFAKQENIKGGVISVGNKYIEGDGGVYWSNNKPFINVRETLWRSEGGIVDNQYNGFVERVAQRINKYKKDPTSIEGYTVVIAHAWSIGTMNYITRFVEALDDSVELITCDELIDMVSKNVPHTNVEITNDIKASEIKPLCDISSEQYIPKDFDGFECDNTRTFTFTGTEKYNWKYGISGFQYDSVNNTLEGLKLDGSDLGDTLDCLPNSWVLNKFAIDEDSRYLRLFAYAQSNCNVNMRVRAIQIVDGKIVSESLTSSNYEKTLDSYSWYTLDGKSPMYFNYDLQKYIGKEIFISIEQDDTGDGSGEIITIPKIEFTSNLTPDIDKAVWTKNDLSLYFTKDGKTSVHNEGICLEGKDAYLEGQLKIKGSIIYIQMRKFTRPIYEKQDVTGTAKVYINGNIVRPQGCFEDYFSVANTDEYFYYQFNVSAYVDQVVTLKIQSIELNNTVGDHICINSIKF